MKVLSLFVLLLLHLAICYYITVTNEMRYPEGCFLLNCCGACLSTAMSMYVTLISIKKEFFCAISPATTQQISLGYITVVNIKDISAWLISFPGSVGYLHVIGIIIKFVQRWFSRSGKFKKKSSVRYYRMCY